MKIQYTYYPKNLAHVSASSFERMIKKYMECTPQFAGSEIRFAREPGEGPTTLRFDGSFDSDDEQDFAALLENAYEACI